MCSPLHLADLIATHLPRFALALLKRRCCFKVPACTVSPAAMRQTSQELHSMLTLSASFGIFPNKYKEL